MLSVWQPLEDIGCVSWNRQVQHILASASPSGRASVWDLRKNDLIIKVSDHSNRVRRCLRSRVRSTPPPPLLSARSHVLSVVVVVVV